MSEHHQKICINCPAGCHLKINRDDAGVITVTGNRCPRGAAYARQELTDPRRTVTATVGTAAGIRIPVKSSRPVPLAQIPRLLTAIYALQAELPVKAGQILLKNWEDTGIDAIATHSAGIPGINVKKAR